VLQCMGGRLYYPIGLLDDWQVALFIWGLTRTGKSKILDAVVAKIFSPDDAVVASGAEGKFCLAKFKRALIGYCHELTKENIFPLDKFLSWISGQRVETNAKYKNAEDVQATAPLAFVGNAPPGMQFQC
jgi:phage/plasmid-associated DNA primase